MYSRLHSPTTTTPIFSAGGLEPVDPNVARDAGAATTCGLSGEETDIETSPPPSSGGWGGGGDIMPVAIRGGKMSMSMSMPSRFYWPPPWLICPVQQTRPNTVLFSYSSLPAGSHTISFKAVAATSGKFALPPVKAYAVAQPELMGLSPAGYFTVCAERSRCESTAAAVRPPRACPADCSGNGVCNLSNGSCTCDKGFSGAICAIFR